MEIVFLQIFVEERVARDRYTLIEKSPHLIIHSKFMDALRTLIEQSTFDFLEVHLGHNKAQLDITGAS